MWPKLMPAEVWVCSDNQRFINEIDAKKHEQAVGLDALCADVFANACIDGYTAVEIRAELIKHRHLFIKWLQELPQD